MLEDALQKYLPESVRLEIKDDKPITLEHLATHTSGLPRLPANLKLQDPRNPYADYTTQQLYAFLGNHKLRRSPGQYEYSNLGMGLLGHELARRAGVSYEQLLTDRICRPLGMHDTCITLNEDQQRRLALPYDAALGPDKNWDAPTLAGAGAIRSTTDDMLKWIQANFSREEKPLDQAIRLAHQKRHTMKDGLAMGLGWHIARDGFTRWHNGMTGGYSSWLAVVPDRGVGVVVLANTAAGQITPFGEQVTRIAFGEKVQPPRRIKEIEVPRDVLESYVGTYAATPQFKLTVTLDKGRLMVQATGQSKLPVFAETKTKFFYKAVEAQISFVTNDKGKVEKLILHQNGRDLEAARMD